MKEKILKEIEKARKKNILFLVEGKKDKEALEKLGISNVLVLNKNGRSIYSAIEEIKEKSTCCILTDADKKGKQIYKILKARLQENGIKTENRIREMLIKAKISHAEGIATYLE